MLSGSRSVSSRAAPKCRLPTISRLPVWKTIELLLTRAEGSIACAANAAIATAEVTLWLRTLGTVVLTLHAAVNSLVILLRKPLNALWTLGAETLLTIRLLSLSRIAYIGALIRILSLLVLTVVLIILVVFTVLSAANRLAEHHWNHSNHAVSGAISILGQCWSGSLYGHAAGSNAYENQAFGLPVAIDFRLFWMIFHWRFHDAAGSFY